MNIAEILAKHVGADGVFNQEAAAKELNEELPKSYVPKHEFNAKNESLKEANKTIETLQKDNKDNETLQTTIAEHKQRADKAEAKLKIVQTETAAKELLRANNVIDVDYALFKIGELELGEDGKIKDFDTKFESFKTANPTHVKTEAAEEPIQNKFFGSIPAAQKSTQPAKEVSFAESLAKNANENRKNEAHDPWAIN